MTNYVENVTNKRSRIFNQILFDIVDTKYEQLPKVEK